MESPPSPPHRYPDIRIRDHSCCSLAYASPLPIRQVFTKQPLCNWDWAGNGGVMGSYKEEIIIIIPHFCTKKKALYHLQAGRFGFWFWHCQGLAPGLVTEHLWLSFPNYKMGISPLISGTRQRCLFLSLVFHMVLEILASAIRQKEKIKHIQIGKEKEKPSLFTDMIIFTENPKESTPQKQ